MKHVSILGFYGAGNIGDEAILEGIVHGLEKHPDKFKVQNVFSVQDIPEVCVEKRIELVRIGKLIESIPVIVKSLKSSDTLLIGGGGLLHNYNNNKAIKYYLVWTLLAKLLGKEVIFNSIGVGPFGNNSGWLLQLLGRYANKIAVRDQQSFEAMYPFTNNLILSADPALILSEKYQEDQREREILPLKIGIFLREWTGTKNAKGKSDKDIQMYVETIAVAINELDIQEEYEIHLIPMHHHRDEAVLDLLASKLNRRVIVEEPKNSVESLVRIIRNLDIVISMRLHSLILGSLLRKPLLSIAYDEKVSSFMGEIGMNEFNIDLDLLSKKDLVEKMKRMIQERGKIAEELEHETNRLKLRFENFLLSI